MDSALETSLHRAPFHTRSHVSAWYSTLLLWAANDIYKFFPTTVEVIFQMPSGVKHLPDLAYPHLQLDGVACSLQARISERGNVADGTSMTQLSCVKNFILYVYMYLFIYRIWYKTDVVAFNLFPRTGRYVEMRRRITAVVVGATECRGPPGRLSPDHV